MDNGDKMKIKGKTIIASLILLFNGILLFPERFSIISLDKIPEPGLWVMIATIVYVIYQAFRGDTI